MKSSTLECSLADKNCPNAKACPLFELFSSEKSGMIFKKFYCESDFGKCQRKQLSDQGKSVPQNLLPNGVMLNSGSGK